MKRSTAGRAGKPAQPTVSTTASLLMEHDLFASPDASGAGLFGIMLWHEKTGPHGHQAVRRSCKQFT
jgi:hypothetical protein